MRRPVWAVWAVLLITACALRPRYTELTNTLVAPGSNAPDIPVRVVDRDEGTPVAGARIELGERARFKATTDATGIFRLPLDKKFVDENALVVISLPKGVKGYRLEAADRPPPTPPAEPTEGRSSPRLDDAQDAGVTTL